MFRSRNAGAPPATLPPPGPGSGHSGNNVVESLGSYTAIPTAAAVGIGGFLVYKKMADLEKNHEELSKSVTSQIIPTINNHSTGFKDIGEYIKQSKARMDDMEAEINDLKKDRKKLLKIIKTLQTNSSNGLKSKKLTRKKSKRSRDSDSDSSLSDSESDEFESTRSDSSSSSEQLKKKKNKRGGQKPKEKPKQKDNSKSNGKPPKKKDIKDDIDDAFD